MQTETIIKSRIDKMLYSILGNTNQADAWWISPNRAFDLRAPVDVYRESEEGRKKVWDYVCRYAFDCDY